MQIRIATRDDAPTITRFIQRAPYSHFHADWRMPVDWIGSPAFLVGELDGVLNACFAVTADPPPAAWIRLVAAERWVDLFEALGRFLELTLPHLRSEGVTELAWLLLREWPEPHLPGLGFGHEPVNWVETLVKDDLALPPEHAAGGTVPEIRPVTHSDLPALASMEAAAFEPMWRHSVSGLQAAWAQALTFDVVVVEDRPVAFQYSSRSREGAHLARITVDPAFQGRGIGSVLLRHTLVGYRRHGLRLVTLNTQADNEASKRLYRRFGFRYAGHRMPVWRRGLQP